MPAKIDDISRWMDEFYSGEGREFPSRHAESETEHLFFDPRYRYLVARWYRAKFKGVVPKRGEGQG